MDLAAQLKRKHVCVVAGSGGVGKTSTSAAIALGMASRGLKVAVLTIDPAKRLADSLGLSDLDTDLRRIDNSLFEKHGLEMKGELYAAMLDAKRTFDSLIERHAPDAATQQRILDNRIYQELSNAVAGSQEYMAMEKLYELHEESDFDLVVVDTPPTRNALDFLDAPRRLSRFLDHRLFRMLMAPSRGIVRAVNVAAQAFLRTVSKVVGGDVVEDAIAFFQAFEGMEEGFRLRAVRVNELLAADDTAFLLVASPRRDTVDEAHYFAERLGEAGISVRGLIVNRVHPRFASGLPEALAERAATLASTDLGALYRNLADFETVATREHRHLAGLADAVAPAPMAWVPFLRSDVHDIDGMGEVARFIFTR